VTLLIQHINTHKSTRARTHTNIHAHTHTHLQGPPWKHTQHTRTSADLRLVSGYHAPGPLNKSLVYTLKITGCVTWRWGIWGNSTEFIKNQKRSKFCTSAYYCQDVVVIFFVISCQTHILNSIVVPASCSCSILGILGLFAFSDILFCHPF